MGTSRRILIIGSTPLASFLAMQLMESGYRVTVMDREGGDFQAFPESLAEACIEGEPLDESMLRRAKVAEAELMIGASLNDNLNLAAAVVCLKAFQIERAIAVVSDPRRANSFGNLGVEVICPTLAAGASILGLVESEKRNGASEGP